jgi:hypothetical protein
MARRYPFPCTSKLSERRPLLVLQVPEEGEAESSGLAARYISLDKALVCGVLGYVRAQGHQRNG